MLDIFLDRTYDGMKLYISIPSRIKPDMIRKTMQTHKIPKSPETGKLGWDFDPSAGQIRIAWRQESEYSKDDVFNAVFDLAGLSTLFVTGNQVRGDAN